MTTSRPVPVIPLVRHSAPSTWTSSQRAELAERLRKVGTTITELSDARERLGFPRLSESSDWDRENAHHNVESPEVQAAIAQLRLEHIELVRDIGARDRAVVRRARELLDLRAGWNLRIAELRTLRDQCGIIEIHNEIGQPAVYDESALFGGVVAK